MENLGTIGNATNPAGTIYKTNAGNHIDAPSVNGRKTDIKANGDGTYNVTVSQNGEITYEKTLTEQQLVKEFGADVSVLNINKPLETNSQEEAQDKYGENVANKFYAVA